MSNLVIASEAYAHEAAKGSNIMPVLSITGVPRIVGIFFVFNTIAELINHYVLVREESECASGTSLTYFY